MNTHILIPIKEWNKFIEVNSLEDVDNDTKDFYLEQAIKISKQISLDEKDIEKRARELAINRNWNPDSLETKRIANEIINSYKQALKDLL